MSQGSELPSNQIVIDITVVFWDMFLLVSLYWVMTSWKVIQTHDIRQASAQGHAETCVSLQARVVLAQFIDAAGGHSTYFAGSSEHALRLPFCMPCWR